MSGDEAIIVDTIGCEASFVHVHHDDRGCFSIAHCSAEFEWLKVSVLPRFPCVALEWVCCF